MHVVTQREYILIIMLDVTLFRRSRDYCKKYTKKVELFSIEYERTQGTISLVTTFIAIIYKEINYINNNN